MEGSRYKKSKGKNNRNNKDFIAIVNNCQAH